MKPLHLLWVGAGRDSMALLLLMARLGVPKKGGKKGLLRLKDMDAVLHAQTGSELPPTKDTLLKMKSICRGIGVPFLHVKKGPRSGRGRAGKPSSWQEILKRCKDGSYHTRPALHQDYTQKGQKLTFGDRSCADNHKWSPLRNVGSALSVYLRGLTNIQWGIRVKKSVGGQPRLQPHKIFLGYRYDERSAAPPARGGYESLQFPFVDLKFERDLVEKILSDHAWTNGISSGKCSICKKCTPGDYAGIAQRYPRIFNSQVVPYEAASGKVLFSSDKHSQGGVSIQELVQLVECRDPDKMEYTCR